MIRKKDGHILVDEAEEWEGRAHNCTPGGAWETGSPAITLTGMQAEKWVRGKDDSSILSVLSGAMPGAILGEGAVGRCVVTHLYHSPDRLT